MVERVQFWVATVEDPIWSMRIWILTAISVPYFFSATEASVQIFFIFSFSYVTVKTISWIYL